jgi:methyltransferase (TIGR00027 family)
MREDRPSTTAQAVAARRAMHQMLDEPRVFDDPLAIAILGPDAMAAARVRELAAPRSRYLRAFVAARSRYAEDQLARSVSRGTRKYVVLGAGLDTFAYRNPYPDLRVFEVDHPATQAWKRRLLAEAKIGIPPTLTFAPVNFEKESFSAGLARVGFDANGAAFFSWLGVTPYLSREVVFANLRAIPAIAGGAAVVLDYAVPRKSLNLVNRLIFDALARRVAAAGEPFRGFFEPDELASELRGMGFREIEDLDSDEINARYFRDRGDRLRVRGALGRLVFASSFS